MARPLVISDCDEVLLHMVRHFRDWLDVEHGVSFSMEGAPFAESMRRGEALLEAEEMWRLLHGFFDTEMPRQTAIDGAVEAMVELQRHADVVILTNLQDRYGDARLKQLRAFGLDVPVYTNQGPKGVRIRQIAEAHGAARAIFIDDLAQHHASAAEHMPDITRLHFCGEPAIAPHVPCALVAGHAHARIDNWAEAVPWLIDQLHTKEPR
ncbi:HAD family hydrolase [Croceibacterium sp. TMG7-5b_MA50]|uniref:HAD family hydrolase n=1 Tax=Croceibacterium sp. TMG7-5b_MA50 TaxID=3121290 RepID=UPI0032219B6F